MAEFFRIVRVRPNGREDIIRDIPLSDVTPDRMVRAEAYAEGESRKAQGQHIRIYTSNNEVISPGDLVWESTIDYGGG
jgi:hypothetical protein